MVRSAGEILIGYARYQLNKDWEARERFRSLQVWPQLNLYLGAQPYILKRMDLNYKRGFAQLRLANNHVNSIRLFLKYYKIFYSDRCMFCFSESVDLNHVLNVCPHFTHIKAKFFPQSRKFANQSMFWHSILSPSSIQQCKDFVRMVWEIMKV